MVKFLWLSIKPESYFLLVNYLSSTLPIIWLALPVLRLQNEKNFVGEDSLLTINIVFTSTLLLANLAIFLHYTLKTNIYSRFVRFYVHVQLVNVALLLLFTAILIDFELYFKKQKDWKWVTVVSVFFVFLCFLAYWSYMLRGIVKSEAGSDIEEELDKPAKDEETGEPGNEAENEDISHPLDQDLENQVNNDDNN